MEELISQAKEKMRKSVTHLQDELLQLRSSRASTSLVDELKVQSYGQQMPLKGLASISTPDVRTLTIQVWDKNNVAAVEKALTEDSNLGLQPNTEGNIIRINLPTLTEERRTQLKRVVAEKAEAAKVSLRAARHESLNEGRTREKDKTITEDDVRDLTEKLNQLIEAETKEIDQLVTTKNQELMEV